VVYFACKIAYYLPVKEFWIDLDEMLMPKEVLSNFLDVYKCCDSGETS
jgi:hypothetical protein